MYKVLLVITSMFVLAACATPAQVANMQAVNVAQLAANSPLRASMSVNTVTGGQETNPLWTSEVSGPDFQAALTESLRTQGILAETGARYRLDATLMSVEQPFAGFDMTVTSTVRYVVTETASGRVAFDEIIQTPFTAQVSDAFIGAERLRLANEGAIRNNLAQFMTQLTESLGSASPVSALQLGRVS